MRWLVAWAWLLAAPWALAQQPRLHIIGVLILGGPYVQTVSGLREGLREAGWVEGRHYVLQVSDSKGDVAAAEVAARRLEVERVDVIVAVTTSVAVAAKRATRAVPIVFYAGTDPVANGLVQSFRQPGGRTTGIHGQSTDLATKRLELLKEMIPALRRVIVFNRPDSPVAQQSLAVARKAAQQLGVEIVTKPVAGVAELRASVAALRLREADAVFYVSDAMVSSQMEAIVEGARSKGMPTMAQDSGSVAQGALASYGESFETVGRMVAKAVYKVLQGTSPATLPVEQVDRLHLVINLRTAKALGIVIPKALVHRADELIE